MSKVNGYKEIHMETFKLKDVMQWIFTLELKPWHTRVVISLLGPTLIFLFVCLCFLHWLFWCIVSCIRDEAMTSPRVLWLLKFVLKKKWINLAMSLLEDTCWIPLVLLHFLFHNFRWFFSISTKMGQELKYVLSYWGCALVISCCLSCLVLLFYLQFTCLQIRWVKCISP